MVIGKAALLGTAIAAILGADMSGALDCTRIFCNTNDEDR
jgi:hypothetical protein